MPLEEGPSLARTRTVPRSMTSRLRDDSQRTVAHPSPDDRDGSRTTQTISRSYMLEQQRANKGHSTRRCKCANAPMQPPVLLSTTHRKGDKRDGLYDDEGSAAGGKRSCVLMHFVMYSTHLCSVSGQKVVCPQEQVHLVEYGTTRGNCAAGKSNPNCCI